MRGAIGPERRRPVRPVLGARRPGHRSYGASYGVVVILLTLVAALAAGLQASDLFSPPPPPAINQMLELDGRFPNGGDASYFDTEIVALDLVSVGYNPMTGQAKVTQEAFNEPGTLTRMSEYEKSDPFVPTSLFRGVDFGVLDPNIPARPPQIVAAGGQFNFSTPPPHFQGMVCFFERAPGLMHMANWETPMPYDVFFFDVAVGNVLGFGNDYWVAVGHVPIPQNADRGIVVVGQYSGGFIPPPVIQEFTGSWLYFTAIEIAELNTPPTAPPEIVLAGVRENKSFLQVARFDFGQQKVLNLANVSLPSPLSSIPWSVKVADLENDGSPPEIIVGGQEGNQPMGSTQNRSRVSVWNWDGATQLSMKRDRVWTGTNSDSAVHDLEVAEFIASSPGLEVASIGYNRNSSTNLSIGGELNLMDKDLKELDKMVWFGSDIDHWGMSSGDPDGDTKLEIVSAGMKTTGSTEVGEIQVVEIPELRLAAAIVPILPGGALVSRKILDRFRARRA